MGKTKRMALICVLLWVLGPASLVCSQTPEESEGVFVGRITHITGKLLRYVPEEKDWVVTVKDAPFGLNDALYSDRSGKAEFVMPNGTLARIGGDTQIQLIALRSEVTEIDVASGVARFYDRSEEAVIKVTTPFGYIVARSGTVFDLYVGDESLEVIALKGNVDFVLESDETRYEVASGSSSLLSDGKQVSSGEGNVDADWDDWNAERDSLWSRKAEVKGDSVKYIPPPLYDDAYDLDEHGRWERVYYEDSYHYMWRPTHVHVGWRPYTVGRWSDYYGDQCWVPAEPFGYVTHHYGSWVYANDFWYWAPPVARVAVAVAPVVSIGFGWYPGRVGWFGSGVNIGWFPLAPRETYYCRHPWGPRAVVVNNVNINTINININNYRYADYAVGIPRNSFYRVNNYYGHNIMHIDRRTIINNRYVTAPVLTNRVFSDYDRTRERFTFTNDIAHVRPHRDVLNRIQRNELLARQTKAFSASAIDRDISRFKRADLDRSAVSRLQQPSLRSRLVSPADVNKPASDLRFDRRDLKSRARAAQDSAATRLKPVDERRVRGRQVVEPGTTGRQPGAGELRGRTGRPGLEVQPGQPGEIQSPRERGKRERPTKRGEELQPGVVEQPGDVRGKRIRPGVEGELQQPGEIQSPRERGKRERPTKRGEELQPGVVEQPVEPGTRSLRPRREVQPGQFEQQNRQLDRREGRRVSRPPSEPSFSQPPATIREQGSGARRQAIERPSVSEGQMGVTPRGQENREVTPRSQRMERRQRVQEEAAPAQRGQQMQQQSPQMQQQGRQIQQVPPQQAAPMREAPQQIQRGRQVQQPSNQQVQPQPQNGRKKGRGQAGTGEEEGQQPGFIRRY